MFSHFFIRRPIFASVLSIVITLAGGIALFTLPVAQFPQITPPSIIVQCNYPGANAQVVADSVAAPIEQQVNGVEDMIYMVSQSNNDGSYTLTVTFKPGVNLNFAQVLVQNRINLALPLLPDVVKQAGVTTRKRTPDILMVVGIFSPNRRYNQLYLSNFATIKVKDELARVDGVGDVFQFGQQDYSMRVWVDPDKLSTLGIAASDVANALREENQQFAAGHFGQSPGDGLARETTITALGRLSEPEEFDNVVIRTNADGAVVRVRDVGRTELGARNLDSTSKLDGNPNGSLAIFALPDANSIATARRVRERMQQLSKSFPEDVEYAISLDMTPFIQESINEVVHTLIEAVVLVALVVLVFLQNWRSALIPLVAVPVAIIGTFAVMAAIGFSLNTLTMFGLVLAIGIVVDDAIVVVEAVEHHIEEGLSPRDAAHKAMDQVSGPVIAVALVLSAVFVPCAVHQRDHRPVFPAVRPDHRRFDRAVGVQLADVEPGPGGDPAASQGGEEGPAGPTARAVSRLVLSPLQRGFSPRRRYLHDGGRPQPAPQCPRPGRLRRAHLHRLGPGPTPAVRLHPQSGSGPLLHRPAAPGCGLARAHPGSRRSDQRRRPPARRHRSHHRHRRAIVHAQCQRLELRQFLLHARRFRQTPPSLAAAATA